MRIPSINKAFEDRNLAVITLVFMSVQFVALEGMDVSIPKVIFMAIMPFVYISKFGKPNKALAFGLIYLIVTMFMCEINCGISSMSTFIYSLLFIITFAVYYELVWENECFTLDFFLNLIKWLILSYVICLLVQQAFILVGIRNFALVNLNGGSYYAFNHLNTLAIEPSHAGRLMAVFFYAFLKCTEYANGGPMGIKELYHEYKWILLGFLYFMLMIGSGTAIVGLAIVSLYFVKKKYVLFIVIASICVYTMAPYIDYEPINRAVDTLNAAMTGDTNEVIKADHSASSRVNIILDTFTKTNLADPQIWIGYGMDSLREYNINAAIYQYGMISYLSKIFFFITCCFTSVLSLETLMFIILFGMNVGNIAYGWATLMVFTTLKYFRDNYDKEEVYELEYDENEGQK